ncbi:hypothetical protein V499_01599 [Pseudogymnoascus sp. VKM F-103]|nr:hypothetical protein V499_01599 [Pseudogymnoascus sp. VKM F-103]
MMDHKNMRAILIATLLGLSTAQSTIDPYAVDPTAFSSTERAGLCKDQNSMCERLCDLATNTNLCNPTTLDFDCTCKSNSSAPGLEYYKDSLPSMICAQNYADCIGVNSNNASTPQIDCVSSIKDKCGTLDSTAYTPVTVLPSPTSTPSSDTSSTPDPTSPPPSDPNPPSDSSGGLSTGAKAGIGAGCAVIGILLIGSVVFYFYRAGKLGGGSGGGGGGEGGGGGDGHKTEEGPAEKVADGEAKGDEEVKDDQKVKGDEGKVFGAELEDTQRVEIGGTEVPGELDAGTVAGPGPGVGEGPVEIGMSEREESELRKVFGGK